MKKDIIIIKQQEFIISQEVIREYSKSTTLKKLKKNLSLFKKKQIIKIGSSKFQECLQHLKLAPVLRVYYSVNILIMLQKEVTIKLTKHPQQNSQEILLITAQLINKKFQPANEETKSFHDDIHFRFIKNGIDISQDTTQFSRSNINSLQQDEAYKQFQYQLSIDQIIERLSKKDDYCIFWHNMDCFIEQTLQLYYEKIQPKSLQRANQYALINRTDLLNFIISEGDGTSYNNNNLIKIKGTSHFFYQQQNFPLPYYRRIFKYAKEDVSINLEILNYKKVLLGCVSFYQRCLLLSQKLNMKTFYYSRIFSIYYGILHLKDFRTIIKRSPISPKKVLMNIRF
ncbi:hypothetical protein pb186bvf_016635 [Paramecium bursaria]